MSKLVKLILTGILILGFLSMPFLFYRLSGFILFAGFSWLTYDAFQRKDQVDVKIYAVATILYNPFFQLPFPHFLWLIINSVVIIGLIVNIFFAEDNLFEDSIKKDDR